MGDRAVLALALAVSLGAWRAAPCSPWLSAVALVVALVWRRPTLVCVAAAILASALAARAWAGTTPIAAHDVVATIVLVSDPEQLGRSTRLVAELDGRRVEVWARASAGGALSRRLAGDRVSIRGRVGPVPSNHRRRLAARHVVGRLTVSVVTGWEPGTKAAEAANRVRLTIERGAAVMTPAERALFTGFVIGDDRAQPAELVDDFRATGLSHLTAVSGENLAFVLVLCGPVLRRLHLRARWAVTVGLVCWFAMLTRFEPSVLRATVMAVISATSFLLARPASTIRLLGLTVAAMTLIDPLIVHSVGWWLSVGATFGIAVLARPIAAHVPGPRWLAEVLSVTAAAQIGVAPVSVAVFGGIPVVSVLANLLAVPAAGPVMVWGLPAGIIAGIVPRPVAAVIHLPSRVLVRWIALVARLAARLPFGQIGAPVFIVVCTALLLVFGARRAPARLRRPAMAIGLATVVTVAALGARAALTHSDLDGFAVSDGARLWRRGSTTILVVDRADRNLLAELRGRHISTLDAVVVGSKSLDVVLAIEPVLRQQQPWLVVAPSGSLVPGAVDLAVGSVEVVGPFDLTAAEDGTVEVHPR